jgi:regulator of RNase E activity RraA
MKKLLGRIEANRVKLLDIPRPSAALIEGFRSISDVTGSVSDVLDELGLRGAVGSTTLKPTIPGSVIVGPALTLRNAVQREHPYAQAKQKVNRMAEIEAHNIAERGDVLVIQGVPGISNMGGISAQMAKRQGEIGAIVEGGVRDLTHSRTEAFPVWASEFTPVTGKWRIETVEINGPIDILGIRVLPGDIVLADDTGVCFVPHDRAEEILKLVLKKTHAEEVRCKAIADGVPLPDLPRPA